MELYQKTQVILGEGSSAIVFKGYDNNTGKIVAIKKPKKKENYEQLLHEVNTIKKIPPHENIVQLLHCSESKSRNIYIVLEYCKGESLKHYMADKLDNAFGAPVYDFNQALLDITAGYQHLRKNNYAHRDIKPENIMIQMKDTDGSKTYKIADMGSAKKFVVGSDENSDNGCLMSIAGTPIYMSAYMLRRYLMASSKGKAKRKSNREAYAPDIDLWSLGCTFVYIACNAEPFTARTLDCLLDVLENKPDNAIMGKSDGINRVYLDNFRKLSPIYRQCSKELIEKYLAVILHCFKDFTEFDGDVMYKKFLELIEDVEKSKLTYYVDVDVGKGYFYSSPSTLTFDNNASVFTPRSIERYRKALKLQTSVAFIMNKDIDTSVSKINLIVSNIDKKDSHLAVIKSSCQFIRVMIEQIRSIDRVIDLLFQLALVVLDDTQVEKIEKEYMQTYNEIKKEIMWKYENVCEVYKDLGPKQRTLDLESLKKRIETTSQDIKKKTREFKIIVSETLVDGKDMMFHLCNGVKKAESNLKNTIIFCSPS